MIKVGIIIPEGSGTFQEDAQRITKQLQITPIFCFGHFSAVLPTVRQMLHEHTDIQALIARSTTAIFLRKAFDLPVVDLDLSNFDFAKTISELPDKSGEFIVVQFHPSASRYDVEAIAKVCNIHLKTVFVDTEHPEDIVRMVQESGCSRVVSSVSVVAEPCRRAGLEVISLRFSPQAIENALRQALYMVEGKRHETQRTQQLLQILNAFSEGFLAVDHQGKIVMLNQALCEIAGIQSATAIGSSLTEVRESMYFIRLLTDTPDESVLNYHGKKYIVNRPHFHDSGQLRSIWSVSSLSSIQEKSSIYQKKLVNDGYRARYHFSDIVSVSPVMEALKEKARRYARTDCNILIFGESGTGKEMMAQSIHNESEYRDGPFVAINCAALPENLLESELFGYEAGAFTGAQRNGKEGLIELSNHGTLFLDEVGLTSLSLQAKLLRSLQERQISRLGGTKLISVENRIICATNNDLMQAVKEGTFREDLFYRLDVLNLRLPPLRERIGDIPFLVRTLLRRKGISRRRLLGIEDTLMHYFTSYSWPGNFRQLEAFLERIFALNQGLVVEEKLLKQLLEELPKDEHTPIDSTSLYAEGTGRISSLYGNYLVSGTLSQVEDQIIREAYRRCDGNITELTQALGVGRTTLWRKLKQLGLRNTP
ncbi:MAG: sigma 54-interacting transcriptional regulator [Oscillospiraceae bacterium]|nr:sigma 54-interacting transcriptional regulator [Oscillospiraceae bacterium]